MARRLLWLAACFGLILLGCIVGDLLFGLSSLAPFHLHWHRIFYHDWLTIGVPVVVGLSVGRRVIQWQQNSRQAPPGEKPPPVV